MSIRIYNTELQSLIEKLVKVYCNDEKFFVGQLKGVSEDSNLILVNVRNEKNKEFPKILIKNNFYNYVSIEEEPFPMEALTERISKLFAKGHVKYIPEQKVISILNGKVIVDENGVRGSGPTADKVKNVYEHFKMDLE